LDYAGRQDVVFFWWCFLGQKMAMAHPKSLSVVRDAADPLAHREQSRWCSALNKEKSLLPTPTPTTCCIVLTAHAPIRAAVYPRYLACMTSFLSGIIRLSSRSLMME
jgi:hypothetical protein